MGHKSLWSAEFNPSYSVPILVQGWGTFLGLFQICKDPKKYLKTPIKATEILKRLLKTNVFVSKGESNPVAPPLLWAPIPKRIQYSLFKASSAIEVVIT